MATSDAKKERFALYAKDFGSAYRNEGNYPYEKKIFLEYVRLSEYFQELFVPEGKWLIDTGNFQTANMALIDHLEWTRRRHPIRWWLATKLIGLP